MLRIGVSAFAMALLVLPDGLFGADAPPPATASPAAVKDGSLPCSTVDLSGKWSFAYTTSHTGTVPGATAFDKASMPVPGCWDDHLERAEAKALWPDAQFHQSDPIEFPLEKRYVGTRIGPRGLCQGAAVYRRQGHA